MYISMPVSRLLGTIMATERRQGGHLPFRTRQGTRVTMSTLTILYSKLSACSKSHDSTQLARDFSLIRLLNISRHRAAMDSEDEEGASPAPPILLRALSTDNETGSSDAEPLSLSEGSLESPTPTTPRRQEKSKDREDDRTSMIKCIVNSVVESETIYVECLNVMLQVCSLVLPFQVKSREFHRS